MNEQQIQAWIQASATLITVGKLSWQEISNAIHAAHPAQSEAELNTRLEGIKNSAIVHKAIADADAGKAPNA